MKIIVEVDVRDNNSLGKEDEAELAKVFCPVMDSMMHGALDQFHFVRSITTKVESSS